jgi:hypothetical protein
MKGYYKQQKKTTATTTTKSKKPPIHTSNLPQPPPAVASRNTNLDLQGSTHFPFPIISRVFFLFFSFFAI